jgi:hypothetical protein
MRSATSRVVPAHPQTRIEYDGVSAEVDEEIAGLILDLWRLGWWTRFRVRTTATRCGSCSTALARPKISVDRRRRVHNYDDEDDSQGLAVLVREPHASREIEVDIEVGPRLTRSSS